MVVVTEKHTFLDTQRTKYSLLHMATKQLGIIIQTCISHLFYGQSVIDYIFVLKYRENAVRDSKSCFLRNWKHKLTKKWSKSCYFTTVDEPLLAVLISCYLVMTSALLYISK